MWVPGKDRRRMRREQEARVRQMRADFLARQRIEQELAGGQQPRRRRASAARRLTFRGRRVLLPFLLLAVLGVCGWLSHARGMAVLAMPALWLLASTAWWFRRGRLRLDRAVERQYAAACIGLGAAWLVLANVGVGPVWLTVGWTVLSLPWWRHHWPHVQPVAAPVEVVESDTIPDRWTRNVAAQNRPLPGAVLHAPTLTEHGEAFTVQLVPGAEGQQLASILGKLPRIAQGLRTPMERIVIDQHPESEDPSVARLQVIHRSPIKRPVYFDEPRWRDGKILLGPYADGIDEAVWRLYSENSMWGGFLLGGTGSGKSRCLEALAVTARAMSAAGQPTLIVYLDGQDGASSPTLWKHATWRGGPREANELLCGLERAKAIRQKWNRVHGLSGFAPGVSPDGQAPGLPGVLVIVDEQHVIFNPQNGLRWANIAREVRKVGMAVVGADQFSDLEAFGGKDALRSSLLAGNGLAMRTASRQAGNLIPGMTLDPATFPELPGYGYKIAAAGAVGERTAPFRARFLPDAKDAERIPDLPVPTVEEWFAKTADAPLDEMTARAFGPMFLDRHALAEQATQAARDEIEGRTPVTIDLAPAPAEDDGTTRGLILAELAKGEPVRPVELERLTGKSKSSVKQALKSLTVDGMIERLTDKGPDGYSVGYVSVQAAVPAA